MRIRARAIQASGYRGFAFGNLVGFDDATLTIMYFGWRGAFWATAILSFIDFIAFYLFCRDPRAASPEVP